MDVYVGRGRRTGVRPRIEVQDWSGFGVRGRVDPSSPPCPLTTKGKDENVHRRKDSRTSDRRRARRPSWSGHEALPLLPGRDDRSTEDPDLISNFHPLVETTGRTPFPMPTVESECKVNGPSVNPVLSVSKSAKDNFS